MRPFSRHAGFFASLKQVEDRLAAEQQPPPPPPPPPRQPETLPFSDTMTASPLFLGPATDTAAADRPGGESSGPAVDFLTLSKDEERLQEEPRGAAGEDDDEDNDEIGEDIAAASWRLLRLVRQPLAQAFDGQAAGRRLTCGRVRLAAGRRWGSLANGPQAVVWAQCAINGE
ncbi:hypothetical protein OsI_01130 [Oryza sativa Indica Group]|uniref:Uncharacterized protein n=1 Tax=Oryza sativa subsp. indica TaxID=39946 RepID=A2WMQ9_ORYSI|nr:hypothetical protein OsI_01130 [Oryza sativa Indica Group]